MAKKPVIFAFWAILILCLNWVWAELPSDGAVAFSANDNLKGPGPSKFIVISGGNASTAKTLTSQDGLNFRISPNGAYVAFDDNSSIYVCELKENATAIKVGSGVYPNWVIQGGETKLFWSSQTGKIGFGSGNSYIQKFDLKTMKLIGDKSEPKYGGKSSIMKGGVDVNGKYASTGYPDSWIAELNGGANACGSGQKCNPSISPTSGKAMFLDNTGHTAFGIYGADGKKIRDFSPGGKVQNPKWATHEDWCSWVQGDNSGNNVYIGKIGGSGSKLYDGKATFPHLYVGKLGAAVPTSLGFSASSKADFRITALPQALQLQILSESPYSLRIFNSKGLTLKSIQNSNEQLQTFTNLSTGHYVLEIKTKNGLWSLPANVGL